MIVQLTLTDFGKPLYNTIFVILPAKVLPLKTSLCCSHGMSNSCSTFILTDNTASEASTCTDLSQFPSQRSILFANFQGQSNDAR